MFHKYTVLWFVLQSIAVQVSYADNPCAARSIPNQSVVCVCNTTYCDDIIREIRSDGFFVTYTSSEAGARFVKNSGEMKMIEMKEQCCKTTTLTLDPDVKYQTIKGFGGAVTDAAALNWRNHNDPKLKQYLIDSYFSKTGIEYNIIRTPIGGSDFSTHPYAYNEKPENDTNLTHFNLTKEDYELKIPMIKEIFKAATTSVHVIATTWSPPLWMKTRNTWNKFSNLKEEYYETYALYHLKYIQSYAAQGIPIWGITTTNEPLNGDLGLVRFNSLGWRAKAMGKWIVNNLGPIIRNSIYKDVKIIAVDDQRISVPYFFNLMVKEYPQSLQYIDGVGVHFYTDKIVPPLVLQLVSKYYPDKFIMSTEACEGSLPFEEHHVILGSWDRAVSYIHDIIEDLNYNLVGWIDWNLCLDENGGPNWASNFVDSPIIVFPEKEEFVKQPMFYAMGHVSKFIPRGSRRIKVEEKKPWFSKSIENVAVLTPNDTVVVIMHNRERHERQVNVRLRDKETTLTLSARSITTLEMPYITN